MGETCEKMPAAKIAAHTINDLVLYAQFKATLSHSTNFSESALNRHGPNGVEICSVVSQSRILSMKPECTLWRWICSDGIKNQQYTSMLVHLLLRPIFCSGVVTAGHLASTNFYTNISMSSLTTPFVPHLGSYLGYVLKLIKVTESKKVNQIKIMTFNIVTLLK